jgi:hypothetical protein
MADIKFTGNKTLKSINKEWCAKFPNTYLSFANAEGKGVGNWGVTHASIRGKKDAGELLTTATMKVSTFESRYETAFGCKVEIKYEKNDRNYRSLNEHNDMTLNEFNKWAKENGGSAILEKHPDWF